MEVFLDYVAFYCSKDFGSLEDVIAGGFRVAILVLLFRAERAVYGVSTVPQATAW